MRLAKILAIGLIGLILGLAWSRSISSGYFQAWEKLPPPPLPIIEFVAVGEGSIIAKTANDSVLRCSSWLHECWAQADLSKSSFDHTRVTKPCDFSSPEFSSFKSHPKNTIDCIQGVTQYAEGVGMDTYILDSDGNVWEWSYIFAGNETLFAAFAPYCCPSFGLLIGIIFLGKRRANAIV